MRHYWLKHVPFVYNYREVYENDNKTVFSFFFCVVIVNYWSWMCIPSSEHTHTHTHTHRYKDIHDQIHTHTIRYTHTHTIRYTHTHMCTHTHTYFTHTTQTLCHSGYKIIAVIDWLLVFKKKKAPSITLVIIINSNNPCFSKALYPPITALTAHYKRLLTYSELCTGTYLRPD